MKYDIDQLRDRYNVKGEVRYWWMVTKLIFTRADTLTIRLILANASLLWAAAALFLPNTFDRPAYDLCRSLLPLWAWIGMFALHGFGVYWRIFDPVNRVAWGLVVNMLGLIVWLLSTILISLELKNFALGNCLEWVFCGASAWAAYRTGLKSELKLLTE